MRNEAGFVFSSKRLSARLAESLGRCEKVASHAIFHSFTPLGLKRTSVAVSPEAGEVSSIPQPTVDRSSATARTLGRPPQSTPGRQGILDRSWSREPDLTETKQYSGFVPKAGSAEFAFQTLPPCPQRKATARPDWRRSPFEDSAAPSGRGPGIIVTGSRQVSPSSQRGETWPWI